MALHVELLETERDRQDDEKINQGNHFGYQS